MPKFLPGNILKFVWFSGEPTQRKIYLTFDDGPHPQNTPRLLELLERLQIKAAFFMLGENVERFPEIVQAVAFEGHSVQSHGFSHHSFWFRSTKEIESSLLKTSTLIQELTGQPPRFFRPPYGHFGLNAIRVCRRLQLKIVLWEIMSFDFRSNVTGAQIARRVCERLQPGSVIVLHDPVPFEKHQFSLPLIMEVAQEKGFSFGKLESYNIL